MSTVIPREVLRARTAVAVVFGLNGVALLAMGTVFLGVAARRFHNKVVAV